MLHRVHVSRWFSLTIVLLLANITASTCPSGKFGPDCPYNCNCETKCDFETGACGGSCRSQPDKQWSGPTCQLGNIAIFKRASQSSTRLERGTHYPARYAVDGNTESDILKNSCSSTDSNEDVAWWQVNLQHSHIIQKIVIYNTAVPDIKNHLAGFAVHVSDSGSVADLSAETLCFSQANSTTAADLVITVTCTSPLSGRYVTIVQTINPAKRLTLCEVQVYVCEAGSYGSDCGQMCGWCLDGEPCLASSGECPSGQCQPGWTSPMCDKNCLPGWYGPQCSLKCPACRAETSCSPLNGSCPDGCVDGWKTKYCNVSCGKGLCVESCGKCLNNAACDTAYNTGVCPDGCDPGWKTDLCNIECPPGLYGRGCELECGQCKRGTVCNGGTGQCPEGCQRGYIGSNCDFRDGSESPSGGGQEPTDNTGVIVGCVIAAILVLAVGILILLFVKRKNAKPSAEEGVLRMNGISHLNGDLIHGRENPGLSTESIDRASDGNHNMMAAKVPPFQRIEGEPMPQRSGSSLVTFSPTPVAELKSFIEARKASPYGFQPEFEMLPTGLMTHADMGTLPFNRPKNRFQAILPYDYNRVVLDTSDRDPLYQYVNASFVDGYQKSSAYIIAQAPMKLTSFDFWRMIWQEDVGKIVMITKLVEAGKVKSEQYWSDFDPRAFGSFVVQLESSVELSDFTMRTFQVTNSVTSEQRIVKHFHFTSWPDHGVPRHPLGVLLFRKKIISASTKCTGPIIVHCSAGIGRSGTYIALEILIEQAIKEQTVDVYNTVLRLRRQRANVIPYLEQYRFLYEALFEATWFEETSISMKNFPGVFEKLTEIDSSIKKSKLQDQYELLESVRPVLRETDIMCALIPENVVKNRHQDILAGDYHRPFLSTHQPGSTDYINAVKIPSYRQKTVFFVTELPLPYTVVDFWRLVYDHTCSTIVLLGEVDTTDKACGIYWPEEIGTVQKDPFQVELASSKQLNHNITERVLKLNMAQGIKKERMVKQFQFHDWPHDADVPASKSALLELINTLDSWQQECGSQPVIIQCLDGCRFSGVFCALYLLVERLQIDHEVDIFSTVRLIREARPKFITSLDQYRFCHELLQQHIEESEEEDDDYTEVL